MTLTYLVVQHKSVLLINADPILDALCSNKYCVHKSEFKIRSLLTEVLFIIKYVPLGGGGVGIYIVQSVPL